MYINEEIKAVLEPNEKIVWHDVINRKVLLFHLIFSLLVIAGASFFFFSTEVFHYSIENTPKSIKGATIGSIFLTIALIGIVITFYQQYVKVYIISNKRVLIKSGIIGTDFNSIYFTEVKTANVSVGLIDKLFSVGTVNIDTGKIEMVTSTNGKSSHTSTRIQYDKLEHIINPYEVYKYFQTTLTGRQESLYSGRADRENNPSAFKKM